jgi:hypothetical protein
MSGAGGRPSQPAPPPMSALSAAASCAPRPGLPMSVDAGAAVAAVPPAVATSVAMLSSRPACARVCVRARVCV